MNLMNIRKQLFAHAMAYQHRWVTRAAWYHRAEARRSSAASATGAGPLGVGAAARNRGQAVHAGIAAQRQRVGRWVVKQAGKVQQQAGQKKIRGLQKLVISWACAVRQRIATRCASITTTVNQDSWLKPATDMPHAYINAVLGIRAPLAGP